VSPPEAVETEIIRLVGLGQTARLFSALDREALTSIGIDLEAVRARIEAAFGACGAAHEGAVAASRRMQRKPRCAVEVSTASPWRAAGR